MDEEPKDTRRLQRTNCALRPPSASVGMAVYELHTVSLMPIEEENVRVSCNVVRSAPKMVSDATSAEFSSFVVPPPCGREGVARDIKRRPRCHRRRVAGRVQRSAKHDGEKEEIGNRRGFGGSSNSATFSEFFFAFVFPTAFVFS